MSVHPGVAEPHTDDEHGRRRLRRLALIEEDHFWFRGRRELMVRMLDDNHATAAAPVADFGCGTGYTLEYLRQRGFRGIGLDLHAGDPGSQVPRVRAEIARAPLSTASVDGVLMLDVLEHVEEKPALAEVHRVLRTEGWFFLTVPAMPWLWGQRDEAAGHLRRYTRAGLAAVLRDCRFSVVDMRYYQCFLFPAVVAGRCFWRHGRKLLDLEDYPRVTANRVLSFVNRREVAWSSAVHWPWGSSLAVFCRKCPS